MPSILRRKTKMAAFLRKFAAREMRFPKTFARSAESPIEFAL